MSLISLLTATCAFSSASWVRIAATSLLTSPADMPLTCARSPLTSASIRSTRALIASPAAPTVSAMCGSSSPIVSAMCGSSSPNDGGAGA